MGKRKKEKKVAATEARVEDQCIAARKARQAFDLNREPRKLRDQYGRNQAGQRLLMARRLVEAGVRFVSVTYGGWDMHQNIRSGMRRQLPPFDQAFATLVADRERRGLLASTLVMVTSEFGRTPKINRTAGRDHYPKVFSIVMAGGGLKQGQVYGASNATATEVDRDPLTVQDPWARSWQRPRRHGPQGPAGLARCAPHGCCC